MKVDLHKIVHLAAGVPGTAPGAGQPPHISWDKLIDAVLAFARKHFRTSMGFLSRRPQPEFIGGVLELEFGDLRIEYFPKGVDLASGPEVRIDLLAWRDSGWVFSPLGQDKQSNPDYSDFFKPNEELASQLREIAEDLARVLGVDGKVTQQNLSEWYVFNTLLTFPAKLVVSEDFFEDVISDERFRDAFAIIPEPHNHSARNEHQYEDSPAGVYDYLVSEGFNPPNPDRNRNAYRPDPYIPGVWQVDFTVEPLRESFWDPGGPERLIVYLKGFGLGGSEREYNDYEEVE